MKFKQFLEECKTLSSAKVNEAMSTSDMYGALLDALDKNNSKFDQDLWDYLETATANSGVYAGDATPEDLIDLLDDKEIKYIYNKLSKKYSKLLK